MKASGTKSPWAWVPSLYFAEGVPYFLVNTISLMMFARLGMPNDKLAFFTSLLYFPWFLKCLWGPLVDTIRTKRWWVLTMQAVMSVLTIALSFTVTHFSLAMLLFLLIAFCSATHDIAADGYYMLALHSEQQARFVGIRSTFYRLAMIFGQGALIVIAGLLEDRLSNIPQAWALTIALTAATMLLLTTWHVLILGHPEQGQSNTSASFREFGMAFITFFRRKGIVLSVAFLLLYRMSEGLMVKLTMPFMLDMGYTTATIGFIYGTTGVIALLLGGILGGLVVAQLGLKRSLWPMALSLTLPSLVYVVIAIMHITNPWVAGSFICFEQFGYGFGFAAYLLYMIHISEGEYKTSHYAICTAFMALSMMIPGFFAGALEMEVGYTLFFIIANTFSILTFIVTELVRRTL